MQLEPHSRPRPPASRRVSQQKAASNTAPADDVASSSSRTASPLAPSSKQNRLHTQTSATEHAHDLDLDLDLPSHLTAALGAARMRKPRVLQDVFSPSTESGAPPLRGSSSSSSIDLPSDPSAGLHHKWSVSTGTETCNTNPSSVFESAASTGASLDREWVGGLAREDLESLLYEANEVIRERERDLGIAAAIGQALLQKNISLRNKHQGVMSQFSSSADLMQQYSSEELSSSDGTEAFLYSPPTNDGAEDMVSTPMPGECHESTPTQTQTSSAAGTGYFPPFAAAAGDSSHDFPPSSSSRSILGFPGMQPCLSGLIPSAPQSPDAASVGSSIHANGRKPSRLRHKRSTSLSATQKQLSLLSVQNETLLSQLAELQQENEEAKRQGSRKLRKLNKEIEGLQTELEAATERNVQLEHDAETNAASSSSPTSSPRKQQRFGFGSPLGAVAARSRTISDDDSRRLAAQGMFGFPPSELSISDGIDAILSRTAGHEEYTSEQRDVVVRLLGKVRELEKINALLEEDRKEREGRLGQALERGVRISDEYDAVLHAHQQDVNVGDDVGSPSRASPRRDSGLLLNESPATQRRKAIGNRVQVEGRRTVRRALRQHRQSIHCEDLVDDPFASANTMPTSSTMDSLLSASSNDSSTTSTTTSTSASLSRVGRGPRRKRSALALNRPRILITPSMEDLAAKRREQAEGWEDVQSGSADTHTGKNAAAAKQRSNSLDPSDAHWITEMAQRRMHAGTEVYAEEEDESDVSLEPMSSSGPRRRHRRMSWSGSRKLGHAAPLGTTLHGEIGHAWSHDCAEPDFDTSGMQTPTPSLPVPSPARPALRSKASFESMTSDIANLQWSVDGDGDGDCGGDETRRGRPAIACVPPSMSLISHSHVDVTLTQHTRDGGAFDVNAGEEVLPRGALRDLHEPREEQYSLLEQFARDAPVRWADDDDYGRPIKESDARRMGLLMPMPARAIRRKASGIAAAAGVGLISWAIGGGRGKQPQQPQQPQLAAIQSAEQVEAERQREARLRRKYHEAMKVRGLQTRRHVVYGSDEGEDDDDDDDDSSAWHRQVEDRFLSVTSPHKKRQSLKLTRQTLDEGGIDENYDVVAHDATTGPSASYYPASSSSPRHVRRRQARRQGLEAVNELRDWASLVFVLIIAFFVSASRGEMNPKRILGGQGGGDGKSAGSAPRPGQQQGRYQRQAARTPEKSAAAPDASATTTASSSRSPRRQ